MDRNCAEASNTATGDLKLNHKFTFRIFIKCFEAGLGAFKERSTILWLSGLCISNLDQRGCMGCPRCGREAGCPMSRCRGTTVTETSWATPSAAAATAERNKKKLISFRNNLTFEKLEENASAAAADSEISPAAAAMTVLPKDERKRSLNFKEERSSKFPLKFQM